MELKNVILETLATIDSDIKNDTIDSQKNDVISKTSSQDEIEFLKSLRERILVLFEGLTSSECKDIENKLELVINFLEYQLSVLDKRIDNF